MCVRPGGASTSGSFRSSVASKSHRRLCNCTAVCTYSYVGGGSLVSLSFGSLPFESALRFRSCGPRPVRHDHGHVIREVRSPALNRNYSPWTHPRKTVGIGAKAPRIFRHSRSSQALDGLRTTKLFPCLKTALRRCCCNNRRGGNLTSKLGFCRFRLKSSLG